MRRIAPLRAFAGRQFETGGRPLLRHSGLAPESSGFTVDSGVRRNDGPYHRNWLDRPPAEKTAVRPARFFAERHFFAVYAAFAVLALVSPPAQPAAPATGVGFAVLELADDPRYDEARIHARGLAQPTGRPFAGAEVAVRESAYAASALKLSLKLERATVTDPAELLPAINRLEKAGVRYLLADLPAPALAALAAATRGRDLILFNVSAADDALRQGQCQSHLLHVAPSYAMIADGLAQYLVERKWRNVLLLHGPGEDDAREVAAAERAAKRFGLKIVDKRKFVLSNDPRQRELGNVGLLTAGADYDVVWVADADGEFARGLPYRTVKPRPVVGADGLAALAWHAAWERHGAPQLNGRFEKQNGGRPMGGADWAAWVAVKSVIEALQRGGGSDFRKVSAYLRGNDITIDGFKGNRLSFRPWDNQLRQPLLIATHNAVAERVPLDGFLHQGNKLDTLGFDRPDSVCRLP